jgi:ankyrin repeat protein
MMDGVENEEVVEKAKHMNRDMLKLLVKGKAANIDELDPLSSSTPLMMACEYLTDLQLFKILLEDGKEDVNAVNNEGKTPLGLLRERL